jgi:hypothetical protein
MNLIYQRAAGFCQLPPPHHLGFRLHLADTFAEVAGLWEAAAPTDNVFLQNGYLQALAQAPLQDTQQVFGVFFKKEKPVGVIYGQTKFFSLEKAFNGRPVAASNRASAKLKAYLVNRLQVRVLTCGNLSATGENAYHFGPEVPPQLAGPLVHGALHKMAQHLARQMQPVDLFFLKEFFAKKPDLEQANYAPCTFEPVMQLALRPAWASFDDYLDSLHAKARTRAKRALKKAAPLEKRELSLGEITHRQAEIHALYHKVADQSRFNLFHYPEGYAAQLKAGLGDRFRLLGYFDQVGGQEKLVGFCTTIDNYGILEAHFIGFDQAYNASHQLYLAMLYDMLAQGIGRRAERINYGRTATEIKSSLGAEPVDMYCYLRHHNPLLNALTPNLVNYLNKPEPWQPRNPFKEMALALAD